MLIPSTITALRTRRYDSTWYIPGTIHGVENAPMDGGGRYTFQPPNVSRSIRLRGPIYLRRLHHYPPKIKVQSTNFGFLR